MKSSLIIIAFFCAGVLCGNFDILPKDLVNDEMSVILLYALMLCVGISLGCDSRLREIVRTLKPRILLYPLGTTLGTFLGASIASIFLAFPLSHCLAVGSGFAYYSLSSILISQAVGSELGTVALVCNVAREAMTLLLVPLMARWCQPVTVIAMGGATTMDTTLPILTRCLGTQWVFVALVHAIVLDFSVPFWVTFFCSL